MCTQERNLSVDLGPSSLLPEACKITVPPPRYPGKRGAELPPPGDGQRLGQRLRQLQPCLHSQPPPLRGCKILHQFPDRSRGQCSPLQSNAGLTLRHRNDLVPCRRGVSQ